MALLLKLTEEQLKSYNRFIKARDKMRMVTTAQNALWPYIPKSEIVICVDVAGRSYPAFVQNDDWLEYLAAFDEWLHMEPEFRKQERMSAIRGDYGRVNGWSENEQED